MPRAVSCGAAVWRETSLAGAVRTPRNRCGPCSACWTAGWRDAERTLRNQPFRRIRCMCTRTLDAVEASSGGQRRALGYLGEVLVEEYPGDELLARSDADLVVEALGVVLDRVRGGPATRRSRSATVRVRGAWRPRSRVVARTPPGGRSLSGRRWRARSRSPRDRRTPSPADAWRVTQPSSAGTVTTSRRAGRRGVRCGRTLPGRAPRRACRRRCRGGRWRRSRRAARGPAV